MNSLQESLASWATIVGTLLSLVGLIQSRAWLTGVSLVFVVVSIIAGLYARRQRLIVDSATVKIEGRSIDSLNIANLRRRINGTLVIQEARHVAEIEGKDLKVAWKYSGYCRAEQETAIEFSVDTDSNIPFADLDCCAYDLGHDPGAKNKIRPMLIGPDGISKKIAVPFLHPLTAQQPFSVLLKCVLPGCMQAGLEYYTSTLSFGQDQVRSTTVRIVFAGALPQWLRVYECAASGRAKLVKALSPLCQSAQRCEYLDVTEDTQAQSARVYMFWRPPAASVAPSTSAMRSAG